MQRHDVAGAFVADGYGGTWVRGEGHHVGMAEGGGGDFNEELVGAGRGDGDLVDEDFGLFLSRRGLVRFQ